MEYIKNIYFTFLFFIIIAFIIIIIVNYKNYLL